MNKTAKEKSKKKGKNPDLHNQKRKERNVRRSNTKRKERNDRRSHTKRKEKNAQNVQIKNKMKRKKCKTLNPKWTEGNSISTKSNPKRDKRNVRLANLW